MSARKLLLRLRLRFSEQADAVTHVAEATVGMGLGHLGKSRVEFRTGWKARFVVGKNVVNRSCQAAGNLHLGARLIDSLSLSRHGESSGEHGSVKILDPTSGNSL